MNCIEHFGYYDSIVQYPKHFHTSCELLYLHEGELNLIYGEDKKVINVTSGMVYVIPSCAVHESVLKNKDVYKRTLMFINPWTYNRSYYCEIISNFLMGISDNEPVVCKDDFGCAGLLEKINQEMKKDDAVKDSLIICAVTEILANIVRKENKIYTNRSLSKLVIDIQNYIRENCSSPLMISDIADKFYINKYYLSHIFKEQTGMPPKKFLTVSRLSKAYGLLYNSKLKISEISQMCGFSSPSDMGMRFKQQYNISPMEFRKKISEESKSNFS